jgi:opacity protein-like surface antigen
MKKLVLTAAAAAVLAASTMTFAAGTPMVSGVMNPWYVGVGINRNATMTDKIKDSAGDSYKLNSAGVGGNLFVGYRMSRIFGTELGLSFLGEDQYKSKSASLTTTYKVKMKNQWNLTYVGQAFMPVASWFNPYVFAGVGYMNAKVSLAKSSVSDQFGGFGVVYGAGLLFNFNQFGVRVSYTVQNESNSAHLDSMSGGHVTIKMPQVKDYISLDVLYRFGA